MIPKKILCLIYIISKLKDDENGEKIFMENLGNHLRSILTQRKDKLDFRYDKPVRIGIVQLSEEVKCLPARPKRRVAIEQN